MIDSVSSSSGFSNCGATLVRYSCNLSLPMPPSAALSIILSKLLMPRRICSLRVFRTRKFRSSRYLCLEGSQKRLYQPTATMRIKLTMAGTKRPRSLTDVGMVNHSLGVADQGDSGGSKTRKERPKRQSPAVIYCVFQSLPENRRSTETHDL